MTSCLNWYRVMNVGNSRIEYSCPEENLVVTNPVFYGGALKDFVALNAVNKAGTVEKCKNMTIHEYDGGHWVTWEAKDEVNHDLLS
ncbi:hypothetical protein IW262DRAFT_666508 [Armillaria fumosa]|nr:hypothetical protein IW262DRAFT_666508 [Armillaria fumosa]